MNPWDLFKDGIFMLIEWFNTIVGDWGLAIILITIIFRAIMLPIMHKQTKSSFMMKKMNPEMNRIKELYADDQKRQSEELQKVYAEAKFNPISGCIPMFIQMPIFIALYQALREVPDRIGDVSNYCFFNLIPDLVCSPQDMWNQVGEIGYLPVVPYIILIIVFAGATFIPMILQQQGGDPKQRKQTLIMSGVMSVFMLFIGWTAPAGVLLFWGTSSILALIQQRVSMKILDNKDKQIEEEKEYQPVKVDVVRKEKSKRPRKKK